jgi:hypothetical protein
VTDRGRRKKTRREIFACPHCGADVAVGAKACRECGSDAETGWQTGEEIDYQSIDIPEGWGPQDEATAVRNRWWIPVVAIVLAVAMLFWAMRLA